MVLEIVGAAVMIAFGLLAVYLSIEGGKGDSKLIIIMLIGIALIVGGGWIIATRISLALLLAKIAGLILLAIGFFLIWGFPDSPDYQHRGMANTGVFLGIVLFIIGIYLLVFFS